MSEKLILWRVSKSAWRDEPILVPVQVERMTEDSLWINGRRNAKRSSYDNYFDTFAEAKSFAATRLERQLQSVRESVVRLESDLNRLNKEVDPT